MEYVKILTIKEASVSGAHCKWLELKEYLVQIKLEDVNIEYKCNKNNIKQVINNNKEENTCLDHILIRWKTPYSFNIIKGYYIHLKKIKKIKGKKHETETQYYIDSNDLNYNEFILMNRESIFFQNPM